MFKLIERAPRITASVVGAVYTIVGVAFWGIYVIDHPINDWLLRTFIENGQQGAYYVSIYSHDLVINVLIALPFAFLLSKIPPKNGWRYVWVALGTSLVLQYWGLFVEPVGLHIILKAWTFYAGFFVSTIALPLAYSIVAKVQQEKNATPMVA